MFYMKKAFIQNKICIFAAAFLCFPVNKSINLKI